MTNPEVVADVRNPWPISSATTFLSGDNNRVSYSSKRYYKRIRAVAVFHRSDEPWKLNQDFLRRALDFFVKWYEHRTVYLSPLMNFIIFLT